MYAIVKTGGKQYKVAPGDKINIEKLNAEVGEQVELTAICVVDGDKVELTLPRQRPPRLPLRSSSSSRARSRSSSSSRSARTTSARVVIVRI